MQNFLSSTPPHRKTRTNRVPCGSSGPVQTITAPIATSPRQLGVLWNSKPADGAPTSPAPAAPKAPAKIDQPRNRYALIKSGTNPGSWSFKNHPEALLALGESSDPRLAALAGEGYVPAKSELRDGGRRLTAKEFWEKSAYLADYQEEGKEVHRMPDDWTKAKLAGDSSSGHRRTVLRTYKGAGIELRMLSATSIKEFVKAINGEVLDIPVEVKDASGKTLQSWVRAVKTGSGEWQTTTLGEHGASTGGHRAAEAVAAVLEARRPTVALEEVGNLLDRRRTKSARIGILSTGKSLFGGACKNIAYDSITKILSVNYVGKVVGRYVEPHIARQFITSTDPLRTLNTLLRPATHVWVRECPDCTRRYAAAAKHTCPTNLETCSAGTLTTPRRRAGRTFRESAVVKGLLGQKPNAKK